MQARAAKTQIVLVICKHSCICSILWFFFTLPIICFTTSKEYIQFCTLRDFLVKLEKTASNISFISYGLCAIWIAVLFSWPLKNTIAIGETIIRQGSLCHFCHFCRLAIIRRSERVPFVISVKHNACLDDRQIWTCAITLCFASFWYLKCFVLVMITLFSVNLCCLGVESWNGCCTCLRFLFYS